MTDYDIIRVYDSRTRSPRRSNTLGSEGPSLEKPTVSSEGQAIESNPKVLPLVDYTLISVAAEAEKREKLLEAVTVDEIGAAHCINNVSGAETLLVAVRIDDNKKASRIPLIKKGNFLSLELPTDIPSRIGFFVGYRKDGKQITGVLRTGLYPGVPLTTQTLNDNRNGEVMYGLQGIKPGEKDELQWAEQIELFSGLDFNPARSRGIFNKNHRPNPATDNWQESPLVIVPGKHDDLVRHFDRDEVRGDELQVLFYGERPVSQPDPYVNLSYGQSDTLLSGGNMRSMETTRGLGLGLGFGDAASRQAQTQRTEIDSLQGAFHIVISPQENHS